MYHGEGDEPPSFFFPQIYPGYESNTVFGMEGRNQDRVNLRISI